MVSIKRKILVVASVAASVATVQGFRPLSPPQATAPKTSSKDADKNLDRLGQYCAQGILIGCLAFPQMVGAVSGGGLDYANMDITGQDFANANYKGKDFTQVSFFFFFY